MFAEVSIGFATGVASGAIFGFVDAWSRKAFAVIFLTLSAVAIVAVTVSTPESVASGWDWPYTAGIFVGVLLGMRFGERLYIDIDSLEDSDGGGG